MLIRRNTKAFKTIMEIINACQDRPDREKLIRLYITKAGHSIKDRISIEGIQGEAGLFYEMNYQAVVNNLKSSNHQLHESDEISGIYFFHSTSSKVWDETPFEFDEEIKKEFSSLPDLPNVRKKEKAEKFVMPTSNVKSESKPAKKSKVTAKKASKPVEKKTKQPDYKLKHEIEFTDLEKIVFRKPEVSKKNVLDYYNAIAEYILPYLKDRPQLVRGRADAGRKMAYASIEALPESIEVPQWIQKANSKSKEAESVLLCNDKEHLLFYAELGCVEFNSFHSKIKSLNSRDYIIIGIESPDAELGKAIDVALATKEILSGLQLPSGVKTDGASGLHVYVPLDGKSETCTCEQVAEYICKLAGLKMPDLISLKGSENYTYGKVSLDYQINDERKYAIAPYSLIAGESPVVATPLLWEEVKEGLQLEDFNYENIFNRLRKIGDPFEALFKKKVNADALLERMEANYSFLF